MEILSFYIPEQVLVALSLFILVMVLKRLLWKPLMKVIDARQTDVDNMLARAEDAKKVIAEMEAERASHSADLERQTVEKMKEARELAGREYDRIIAEANDKAQLFTEAGEEKARRAYEQVMTDSQAAIVALALEAASLVVESSIDSEKNRVLIEAMLKKAGVA